MMSRINFNTEKTGLGEVPVAEAIRPGPSGQTGLLFNSNRRSRDITGIANTMRTPDRIKTDLQIGECGQLDKERHR